MSGYVMNTSTRLIRHPAHPELHSFAQLNPKYASQISLAYWSKTQVSGLVGISSQNSSVINGYIFSNLEANNDTSDQTFVIVRKRLSRDAGNNCREQRFFEC